MCILFHHCNTKRILADIPNCYFRYLPPHEQFLSSLYDFPEIFLCLFQECSSDNAQVSFLTFFSGEYDIHLLCDILVCMNHLSY